MCLRGEGLQLGFRTDPYILPKYSPVATIWLHFFEANKNCSQEFVESSFRVLVFYCYSNNYVELCSWATEVESMDVWLQFPFRLATISLFLATIKKKQV